MSKIHKQITDDNSKAIIEQFKLINVNGDNNDRAADTE